jgi:cytochrome c5
MSSRTARIGSRALLSLIVGVCAMSAVTFMRATSAAAPANPKPDAAASREAFLQAYKVFTSPRCQNCHPAGDAPLQGDDSHVHLQNVKRGSDGHGVYGMRCDTCHQAANLPGEHMPPGNPKWGLPPAAHKMVFVGRSPAELCRQLKDPKQTGGRSLQALVEHIASDDLVGWGWDPGQGRSQPPLSRADTVAQMKTWIEGGAACPE